MKNSKTDPNLETIKLLTISRGLISILFGIIALVWPGLTLVTFAILITIWLLASGVINIIRGIMGIGQGSSWIFTILLAILQIGIGAYLIQRPILTSATIVALIAIAFVVEGVVSIIVPFVEGKRETGGSKALTVIFGVIALLAGISIWRYPVSGGLAFVWVVGLFALISGPMWIAEGMRIKTAE